MYIADKVHALRKKYGTKDVWGLCDALGIHLMVRYKLGNLKGFFCTQNREKYIVVNGDLPEPIQRVIIAHELGHAVLHAGLMNAGGIKCFDDRSPLSQTSQFEREANQFAAELLLSDEDVETTFRETQDLYTAAATLNVPPELLEFKLKMMKRLIKNSLQERATHFCS